MAHVWSKFQEAIFEDFKSGKGHTAIDAVPGAGKSTVLIEGLNHLPSNKSLVMTSFNVQSVEDLRSKPLPWHIDPKQNIRTMNSLGNRAITRHCGGLQKLNKERVYGILDKVLGERPEDPARRSQFNGFRARVKALVDMAKNYLAESVPELLELADMFEMDTTAPEWVAPTLSSRFGVPVEDVLLETARRALEGCKELDGTIDFNDQIWLPWVYQLPLEQYETVLVDEGQDTSIAQMDLLIRSCAPGGRTYLAGENSQAIYAWRGAGLGMEPFIKRLHAKILPLSITYRCPRLIALEVGKVVPGIQAAPDAPEGEVGRVVADMLPSTIRVGDTVLSRTNAPLVRLFMNLLAAGRPVGMQGRDIGEKLTKFVEKSQADSAGALLEYTHEWARIETERRVKKNPNAKLDHIEDHVRCVEVLCEGRESLDEVRTNIGTLLRAPEGNKVLLSTVHRAKGLEWDRVFLLHDTFPVNASYWMQYAKKKNAQAWAEGRAKEVRATEKEEVNVLYVATSRAKKSLFYVMPVGKAGEV